MTTFTVICLTAIVVFVALIAAPAVIGAACTLYARWLLRQLPPHLRALARHDDGVCRRSSCPYPHPGIGGRS